MTKQTIYRVSLLMAITFILWYGIISFIQWDISWIKDIATTSNLMRSSFFAAIVIKIGIDFWVWSLIRDKWFDPYVDEDKRIEKENQEKLRKTFNQ